MDTAFRLIDELLSEGYIMVVERKWNENKYTYPAPTEKGWERLEEGGCSI